ncbi:MAG: hypothetical protein J6A04_01110 [Clostridia bacterium]|nr:hypothetical protein [Clostridia bacterium]
MKENDILDAFFNLRQEDMLEDGKEDIKVLEKTLKDITTQQLQNTIQDLPEECKEIKEKLSEQLDDLVINYQIKMAYYDKKYYKQGFNDAIMINCCCKEK